MPIQVVGTSKPLVQEILAFYQSQPSQYLWPRDHSFLESRASEGHLLVDRGHKQEIRGVCYLYASSSKSDSPLELGGIVKADSTAREDVVDLCRCAMALGALIEPRLYVAHVHEDNPRPGKLLGALGFERHVSVSVEGAPPEMKLDADGILHGWQYRLAHRGYGDLAHWVASLSSSAPVPAAVYEERNAISNMLLKAQTLAMPMAR